MLQEYPSAPRLRRGDDTSLRPLLNGVRMQAQELRGVGQVESRHPAYRFGSLWREEQASSRSATASYISRPS